MDLSASKYSHATKEINVLIWVISLALLHVHWHCCGICYQWIYISVCESESAGLKHSTSSSANSVSANRHHVKPHSVAIKFITDNCPFPTVQHSASAWKTSKEDAGAENKLWDAYKSLQTAVGKNHSYVHLLWCFSNPICITAVHLVPLPETELLTSVIPGFAMHLCT